MWIVGCIVYPFVYFVYLVYFAVYSPTKGTVLISEISSTWYLFDALTFVEVIPVEFPEEDEVSCIGDLGPAVTATGHSGPFSPMLNLILHTESAFKENPDAPKRCGAETSAPHCQRP